MVAATLAINGWWLAVSLRFWHYILDSGYFGLSGLQFALADFLGLVLDTATSGLIGTRTGFRLLFLATCAIGLALWRRERDPRWLPFAAAVLTLLALSYLGAYAWIFRQIQPYRHVLPLGFFALIPAAAAIDAAVRRGALRGLTLGPRLALGLLAVPAAQHLLSDILYFTPSLLPKLAPLYNNAWMPISSQGFPAQPDPRRPVRRHPRTSSQYRTRRHCPLTTAPCSARPARAPRRSPRSTRPNPPRPRTRPRAPPAPDSRSA